MGPRVRVRTRACCWPRRAGTARRSAAWRKLSGSTTGSGRAGAWRVPPTATPARVRHGTGSVKQRPAAGSASLTDAEPAAASLITEGLAAADHRPDVHQHAHGRVPSAPGVPQARHRVAHRPGPDRAGARPARGGANPMAGGCQAARMAARLTHADDRDPGPTGPLARAQAAFHDGTAWLPPTSADQLALRSRRFASSVQFILGDPDTARACVPDQGPATVPRLGTLLPQVLRAAMRSWAGTSGTSRSSTRPPDRSLGHPAGFGQEFLDYFAVVEDVHSTCGRAARQGAQTAVGDVRADPGFTPPLEIAAAAGSRAVQSTPSSTTRSPDHIVSTYSGGRAARPIATCGSSDSTPFRSER